MVGMVPGSGGRGKGNLTPDNFRLILGRRYNRTKAKVTNPKGSNQHVEVKDQIEPQPTTAETLAKELHVSPATVEDEWGWIVGSGGAGAYSKVYERLSLVL
jgi:hypothetical protein